MQAAAWLLVALLFGVPLAGCVSEAGASASTPEAPAAPESATGIRGTVMDDQLAPIAGAIVQVDDGTPVTTGTAGEFLVTGLTPGDHRLQVQALGYVSVARSVSVSEGEFATVELVLQPVPVIEPYQELIVFDGYIICAYALFGFVGSAPSPCPLGQSKTTLYAKLNASWRYFVVEAVWQTSESIWISINTRGSGCTTGAPCPGVEIGRSPLRLDGAPGDEKIAARYALDGKRTYPEGTFDMAVSNLYAGLLREEINSTIPEVCVLFWSQFGVAKRLGCPLGVGYAVGIRFKEYLTVFHWERPADPVKFSAIPDG